MRDTIKRSLLCVAFVTGLDLILFVLSIVVMMGNRSKTELNPVITANKISEEPAGTIDVLILGDSESYCSIIPLKMWEDHGITSYCCGTPAQKLSNTDQLLRKAFENQSPKIVILETNAILREFNPYNEVLQKADTTFSIFNHHNLWKKLFSKKSEASSGYIYIDNAKGYRFTTTIAAADTSDYMKETNALTVVPARNREYIESFKLFCQEKGAKLILVSTPSTVNWNMSRHNAVSKLSEELDIEYIDMNLMTDEIPIDWKKDTRDNGDHLNYFGAQKVTSYLGQYLSGTGLLKSRKNDTDLKQWHIHNENFRNIVSEHC